MKFLVFVLRRGLCWFIKLCKHVHGEHFEVIGSEEGWKRHRVHVA